MARSLALGQIKELAIRMHPNVAKNSLNANATGIVMFRNVRILPSSAQRDLTIGVADQHFDCNTACPFRAVAQFFQLFIETEIRRAAWHG